VNTEKDKLINALKANLRADPMERNAPVYQPIYFADFNDIKTSLMRHEFLKKFDKVFGYVKNDLDGKRVIDIGSNAGYFSFACAERGALVDALEPDKRYYALTTALRDIYKIKNVNFYGDPLTPQFLESKKYDYGFCLSVLQWITEGDKNLRYGYELLSQVSKSVDTLFFELGCNSGKSAITCRKLNHISYIYRMLKDNTEYEHIKFLGFPNVWGRITFRYLFCCSHKDLPWVKEPAYAFLKKISI